MIIGIDPGKITGIGIYDYGELTLKETDFWGCIDLINDCRESLFVVELPKTKHVWHGQATSNPAIQRTGVNVGSALREAELIVKYLHRSKCDYVIQTPLGKLNAEKFQALTGYIWRSNQHMRDAGRLAWEYRHYVKNNIVIQFEENHENRN